MDIYSIMMQLFIKGGDALVKMERLIIQIPATLKTKLHALRAKGYTASGFVRSLLERELTEPVKPKKGREA